MSKHAPRRGARRQRRSVQPPRRCASVRGALQRAPHCCGRFVARPPGALVRRARQVRSRWWRPSTECASEAQARGRESGGGVLAVTSSLALFCPRSGAAARAAVGTACLPGWMSALTGARHGAEQLGKEVLALFVVHACFAVPCVQQQRSACVSEYACVSTCVSNRFNRAIVRHVLRPPNFCWAQAATDAGPTTTLGAAAAGTSDATLARAAADAGPTTLAAAAAGTSDAQLARCPLWQQAQALSGVTPEQAAQIDEARRPPPPLLLLLFCFCLTHAHLRASAGQPVRAPGRNGAATHQHRILRARVC